EVFELFAQADNVPGRPRDGLGIGLTMVRMLTEMHGGRVEVSSAGLGAGSAFTLVLPRRAREDEVRSSNQPREQLPPGRRIVVVDDNRDAADTLAMSLR